jgi:O-acetyl-ADP-ribose deacetylase (regulator of RNase III)
MIEIAKGNLLEAPVEALVNTVNTQGIMGKGIALQFKQAFPEMFRDYEKACKAGQVRLGKMHVYDRGGLTGNPRWIINFPTKGHWRERSRLAEIEAGLKDLVATARRLAIRSIAVPPLGCGNGGLNWADVRPRIEAAFAELPDVKVQLFAPGETPAPEAMPNRTERPKMTAGRAALIALMDRYLKGLLDPFVTLLEIHKLMYFLQEAGEELRLEYEPKPYGPYARNLRQVLIRLDKHYTHGYGDGKDGPKRPIELLPGAVDEARAFLAQHPDIVRRMDRVIDLIEGYEDSYGLELLSTVHWVMRHNPEAREKPQAAIEAVSNWTARKRRNLKRDHLLKAWQRLKEQGWNSLPANA